MSFGSDTLERVRRWLGTGFALDEQRWLVLDVESSGLDVQRDRLLAVAAVAVHFDAGAPRIHLGDSIELIIRQAAAQAQPDKGNILLHGIGVGAQLAGTEAAPALLAFEAWAGRSPLVAFHAAFDRAMLARAGRAALGRILPNPWLDLEPLAAVLYPKVRARALDEWLAHFRIECAVRHQAAADAMATAELMLKLWPALTREAPRPQFRQVVALAGQRRWLPK